MKRELGRRILALIQKEEKKFTLVDNMIQLKMMLCCTTNLRQTDAKPTLVAFFTNYYAVIMMSLGIEVMRNA